MNQNIWGPHAWFFLHTLTLAYPLSPSQTDKDDYLNFLKAFSKIIPCEICKAHFIRNLKENSPRLEGRNDFFEWTVDLHNEINGRTGKRAFTYQEAHKLYEDKYQKEIPLTIGQVPKASIKNILQKVYGFWLKYHTYIIIVILLVIILQLSSVKKNFKKAVNS